MINPQMERALLRFEPLPEDVKKRLIRLDCGDGVLNPLEEVRTTGRIADSRKSSRCRHRTL